MTTIAHRSFAVLWPYIVDVVRKADPSQHVVVFDIDATVLYNTNDNECGAVPNFKIQKIYDYAAKKGIDIFFVTARIGTSVNRMLTERQLHCMGFDEFKGLYMRTGRDQTMSQIARFKDNSRADIERRTGKRVLLNVGDQWSDVVVTTPSSFNELESGFDGKHVLFVPDSTFHSMVAVKLYETES